MPDYSKCVMYKIVCKDTDIKECYIGSTCNHSRRKTGHKNRCNDKNDKGYNLKVYKFIRKNGGWEDWEFVILEKYPCKDKVEKEIRERYWVELMGTLNSDIPSRTRKEWINDNKDKIREYRENNKEHIREQHKKYREKNKEHIREQSKKYYENNKDKIREYNKDYNEKYYEKNKEIIKENSKKYREENEEKIKEYRENNKDKSKENWKKYWEDNKDKINKKLRQPYTCITCNKTMNKSSKTPHEKTKKHLSKLSL